MIELEVYIKSDFYRSSDQCPNETPLLSTPNFDKAQWGNMKTEFLNTNWDFVITVYVDGMTNKLISKITQVCLNNVPKKRRVSYCVNLEYCSEKEESVLDL